MTRNGGNAPHFSRRAPDDRKGIALRYYCLHGVRALADALVCILVAAVCFAAMGLHTRNYSVAAAAGSGCGGNIDP